MADNREESGIAGFVLLCLLALTGCEKEQKFYCLSAGNEVARECLQTQSRCEEGFSGDMHRSCFAEPQAYCFSINRVSSAADGLRPTGERESVCTPTLKECEAWVADYRGGYGQRNPSGCTLASHKEIWP